MNYYMIYYWFIYRDAISNKHSSLNDERGRFEVLVKADSFDGACDKIKENYKGHYYKGFKVVEIGFISNTIE
jgi:hypothetical protein